MKKGTKKIIIGAVLIVLLCIVGFNLKQITEGHLASSKENSNSKESEGSAKVEYSMDTEDERLDEDAKSVEPSSNETIETENVEEEVDDSEEASAQEEMIKEESSEEKEIESTNTEEESFKNTEPELKQDLPQSAPKATAPTEVTESTQEVKKSNVGMSEYLLPFSNSEERVEKTTHVVLHFTSNALNNPQNPYLIEDTYNIFKDYGVSAHYVIGRAGEIYLFVPENRVAYHAGRGKLQAFPEYNDQLNHYSLGIELLAIGTREEMIPVISEERFDLIDPAITGYTEAQYQSLNTLLNDIVARYPHIQKNRNHIVGHDEYSVEKTDPGSLFNWSKIGL